jgi:2-succinyl-5-enolpyruvyl-6-hydroxy-3-cyclohexene-1-carboxylate synthase
VIADVVEAIAGLIEAAKPRATARAPWLTFLGQANAAAWRVVDAVLAEEGLCEGAAVRAVVDALPRGAVLSLGNSLPVRHADAFVRQADRGISVLSQRGASGIDGVVSATSGAAATAGRPTALVVGDLSALHDLGGFAAARSVDVPLVIVVLNNDGGRIFEQLPLSGLDIGEDKLKFWTTPHGGHFGALADLFGIRYARAQSLEHLRRAVTGAIGQPGCTLLEVVVPAHGARDQSAEITRRIERDLGTVGTG